MSEPDSTPPRRPPTIDLTAKEVETETTASRQASAGTAAARSGERSFGAKPYAIGILVGAVAVAALVAGLWLAGFVPAQNAPTVKTAAGDAVSSGLDKIQQAPQAPRPDESLAARMTAAEGQAKTLGDSLAALTRRVDAVAAEAKSSSVAAEEAKNAAEAGVQHSDIEALTNRIAALESAVKSLRADVAQRAADAEDSATRAIVAAEALRAAVERGAPYQAELAAVKSLGADQSATAALEPFAADGMPSAAALGRELNSLVPALELAAEPEANDGSLLGRLESRAQKLVRITPLNAGAAPAEPAGADASSQIGRIKIDAARGDIAEALIAIARLPDAVRAPAAAWIKKAQAREAAIAASERMAADALAAIAKPVSQ